MLEIEHRAAFFRFLFAVFPFHQEHPRENQKALPDSCGKGVRRTPFQPRKLDWPNAIGHVERSGQAW